LRIRDEALLEDFARVAAKLGRWPSRSEYVREGKYSAGAFYSRFGSWKKIKQQIQHGDTHPSEPKEGSPGTLYAETRREARSGDPVIGRSGDLNSGGFEPGLQQKSTRESATEGTESHGGENHSPQTNAGEHRSGNGHPVAHESDKAIAMQWAGAVTAIPGELAGKRRVTDAVCAMIVNTLLGGDWYGQLSRHLGPGKQNLTADERGLTRIGHSTQRSAISIQPMSSVENSAKNSTAETELEPVNERGTAALARVNGDISSGGILDDGRPVMGPPFHWCALSNAPVNELGVVLLFGMLAGELGFQIEAVWGRYPDIEAKRQIRPGKWQRVRIEVEYESRNFAQHGHNAQDCDIIVCWKHNWAKCPKHIEVIELSRVVRDRLI
jgi:hypothetical protein